MIKKIFIIQILVFCLGSMLYAQPYKEATYESKLNLADQLLSEGYYLDAMDVYRELYSESRDPSLLSTIADIEYMIRDYKRAERTFERIFRMAKKEEYPELVFTYARTLKINGDYNEAYRHFNITLDNSTDDSLKTLARNEIEGMKQASDFEIQYDLYVEPLDNKINTAFSDLAPVKGPDGKLYFTTFNRNTYIKVGDEEEEDDDKYARISTSQVNKEGEWSKPEPLNEKINYDGVHVGNASFSRDGNTMYFTRTELSGKKVVRSEAYMSAYDGTDWQAPRILTGVNGEYNVLHPVAGELFGESVLFFVSDRPGGLGGYDVYYSRRLGEAEYDLPVNLGETINSIGDEYTPYYVEGKLYFSSDGHPTMGGMDIFSSDWDGTQWSKPKNLGLGYNSRYDDFHYKTDPATEKGYLVSNRPNDEVRSLRGETCCDDIFSVGMKDIEVEVVATIYSEQKALTGSTIEIAEVNKDGEVISSNSATSKEGNTFKFRLQADKMYRIYAKKPGYERDSVDINTVGIDKSYTFKKEFHLEESEPETEIITMNEPIRLDNIYYDFDDDKILPSAEKDLKQLKELLEEYPDMVIELSSHTDARGNDAYNMDLSQRRANSAKQWLVNRGVDRDRIVAKGYGETQILNECVNGVECSEEKHRLNRRTEFKIIAGPESIEIKKEVIKGTDDTPKGRLEIEE